MNGGTTIDKIAEQHRLKISRDACNDPIIKGKLGEVYEYSDGTLGVLFMPDEKNKHPERSWARKWRIVRDACVAVGMTLVQDGDAEGALTFDPRDIGQVREAIKAAKVKTRRRVSPERAAVLATRLAVARASKATQSTRLCV